MEKSVNDAKILTIAHNSTQLYFTSGVVVVVVPESRTDVDFEHFN